MRYTALHSTYTSVSLRGGNKPCITTATYSLVCEYIQNLSHPEGISRSPHVRVLIGLQHRNIELAQDHKSTYMYMHMML